MINETSSFAFLHLDGIEISSCYVGDHFKKLLDHNIDEERSFFRQHVWSRLASPIQIAIILIQTTVVQLVRGIMLTFAGILSLNAQVTKDGLVDILSVPVQIIALSVFAFISLFHPKKAYEFGEAFLNNFKESDQTMHYEFTENCVRGRIIAFVIGIISVPISIFRNATTAVLGILNFRPSQACASLILIVRDLFVNIGIAFASIGPESIRSKAFYCFTILYGFEPYSELKILDNDIHKYNPRNSDEHPYDVLKA